MSISIKLLIEYNNEKYSVFVESDYKLITFKRVSNQIISQLKQNITLKTHSFELFDRDFGEYVLITNDNQLIENLSRIRVKPKDILPLNQSSDNITEKVRKLSLSGSDLPKKSSENSQNIDLISFCDYLFEVNPKKTNRKRDNLLPQPIGSSAKGINQVFIANNLTEKTKDLSKYLFECKESTEKLVKAVNVDKQRVVEEINDLNSESTDDTVVEISDKQSVKSYDKSCAKISSEVVNYLNIELSNNYGLSLSCPHLYHKTFIEKFRNRKIVVIRYRLEDYKGVQTLLDLLEVNRRCFQNNPSNDDPTNPKWKTVSDQMKNICFNWSEDECKNVFTNALDLYKKTLDKCPDYATADKVNPLFHEFHYFDLKFIISLNEFNAVKELRILFERKLTPSLKKFGSNQSLVPINQLEERYGTGGHLKQKDRVFTAKNFGSNLSLRSLGNGLEDRISKNRSQIDRTKLNKVGEKINEYITDSFKELAKSVETVVQQFGSVSRNRDFWTLVSNQMKANGYKTYTAMTCYSMFTEHVCDYYSLAMTYCSDAKNAQEVYPLFGFIHLMDLSQCLSQTSYNRIKALKQKFDQKSEVF